MLAELGAMIIDLDVLAREAVEPGQPAWQRIKEYFGPEVLLPDGCLNRPELGRRIFQDDWARAALNAFTHPVVIGRTGEMLAAWRHQYPGRVAVVDAPLLLEAGMQSLVEEIWVVYVDVATQIERVMARDGLSRPEAERRVASQMPLEEKLAWATRVIDNRASLEETRQQVEKFWKELQQQLSGGGNE